VLATIRFGTDDSSIRLFGAGFDTAGRIVNSTNALGGHTSFIYAQTSSGVSNTVTYPDGGTRRELFNLDGALRQLDGTATYPKRYMYGVEEEDSIDRQFLAEIILDRDGTNTSEWRTNYLDGLQRNYRIEIAANAGPYPYIARNYNSLGQLSSDVDLDGVTRLYEYNSKGQLEITAVAANQG